MSITPPSIYISPAPALSPIEIGDQRGAPPPYENPVIEGQPSPISAPAQPSGNAGLASAPLPRVPLQQRAVVLPAIDSEKYSEILQTAGCMGGLVGVGTNITAGAYLCSGFQWEAAAYAAGIGPAVLACGCCATVTRATIRGCVERYHKTGRAQEVFMRTLKNSFAIHDERDELTPLALTAMGACLPIEIVGAQVYIAGVALYALGIGTYRMGQAFCGDCSPAPAPAPPPGQ